MVTDTLSPAVQDYLKAVYSLESRAGEAVSTNALAERLGVTPASTSAMLKRLADLQLVEHEPYHGVRITDDGRRAALRVLRRHRLLELFLAETLGMSWERVHEQAEVLEHVLSDELEELIAAKLGNPERDPHGDPIPSRTLELSDGPTVPLQTLDRGARGVFARISDSNPAMLAYLADLHIRPGAGLVVEDKQPFGGPLTVRFGDAVHVLGGPLAQAMRVEVDG